MNFILGIECASVRTNPGGYSTPMLRGQWQYVLDEYERATKLGANGLFLHSPTGRLVIDGKMSALAALAWQGDPDAANILDGARDFLIEFNKRWPKDRIIAYFGRADAWFRELDGPTAWHMARAAMHPWLWATQVDICFDEAGSIPPDSTYGYVIQRVIEIVGKRGGSVLVEPQPQAWSVTANLKPMMLERWHRRYGNHSVPSYRALTGHEFGQVNSPWVVDGKIDADAFIRACHENGDTPIVNVGETRSMKGGG
jgi:hypothetical protein